MDGIKGAWKLWWVLASGCACGYVFGGPEMWPWPPDMFGRGVLVILGVQLLILLVWSAAVIVRRVTIQAPERTYERT